MEQEVEIVFLMMEVQIQFLPLVVAVVVGVVEHLQTLSDLVVQVVEQDTSLPLVAVAPYPGSPGTTNQGYAGGNSVNPSAGGAGGGGGAGGTGDDNAASDQGGAGGNGKASVLAYGPGTPVTYAGGWWWCWNCCRWALVLVDLVEVVLVVVVYQQQHNHIQVDQTLIEMENLVKQQQVVVLVVEPAEPVLTILLQVVVEQVEL